MTKTNFVWLIAMAWLVITPTVSHAQVGLNLVIPQGDNEAAMQQAETTHKNACDQYLALAIEDIDRACKLSDTQRKKLQIAGKGASERTVVAWRRAMKQMMRGFADFEGAAEELNAQDDPKEVENVGDLVEVVEGLDDAEAVLSPMAAGGGAIMRPQSVTHQSIWRVAVKKTLTTEQYAAYNAEKQRRDKLARNQAISTVIVMLDEQLLLSEQQRKQMRTVVDETLGEDLQKIAAKGGWDPAFESLRMIVPMTLSPKSLESILNKAQMDRWKELTKPYQALRGQGIIGGGFF